MTRGLFSGVLWGSVLAVMSLWLLSQIGGMVGLLSEPPSDVAVVAPDNSGQQAAAQNGKAPTAPDGQTSPATDPSRQGTPPSVANTDNAPAADTDPAQVPQAENVIAGQDSPQAGAAPEIEAVVSETPTVELPTGAPDQPAGEAVPTIVAEAPATQAVVPEAESPVSPPTPAPDAASPVAESGSPAVVAEPDQPAAPQADGAPENDFSTPVVVPTPEPVEPEVAEADNTSPDATEADTAPAVPGDKATVIDRTRRPAEPATAEDAPTGGGTVPETDAADGPAIRQYAQEFQNADARPLMALLLLDDGAGAAAPLQEMPFPVTYVVDASKENARTRMTEIRAMGNEVVVLTPLPESAAPKDVEVAFQTYLTAVPEAVAVMDVPDAVFQSGRSVATQVSEALAASGHGMVTYSRGLNSATQVAERLGVPAALVFRVFDENDRDGAAIKRFLDQAAFRAGQQTGVILVGHNRPETIAALLEWSLGNRASTVALAPISAALLANTQ